MLLPHADIKAQLQQHRADWTATLCELFHSDPDRARTFSVEAAGLYLDFSKSHLTAATLSQLTALAGAAGMPAAITALLSGAEVNNTEQRPALHTTLRFQGEPVTDEQKAVIDVLNKMEGIVETLHRGQWLGFSGEAITDVVNIGIGGSDLGPRMMTDALAAYEHPEIRLHFVANVDPAEIGDIFKKLRPQTTLFIVASKSFTTLETLENANTASRWLQAHGCLPEQVQQHFIAISSKPEKAQAFGINPVNVLPMWDWVGGRYSLWSAIGLPVALAVGMQNFRRMLAGAHAMDRHFAEAPLSANMPVIMALLTWWYSQCWDARTHAVLPYNHHMHHFPAFLQQLDMESLGKSVDRNGQPLSGMSGSIVWGTEGTNGQHSFHQLLHQGTHLIPVDFIATLHNGYENPRQQQHLFACCISQSQALLQGKTLAQAHQELLDNGHSSADAERLAPHMVVPGNRPSNTLLLEALTPFSMGALTALYEHKVYALSVLLGLNAFDQWGVEIGKQLGKSVFTALDSGVVPAQWDASTAGLAQRFIQRNPAA
jgi:glucose-6-phosphate isomerase